jgi:hypothetical protein
MKRDWKWLQQTIRPMLRCLVALADDTQLAVLPDERLEFWPSVLSSDKG